MQSNVPVRLVATWAAIALLALAAETASAQEILYGSTDRSSGGSVVVVDQDDASITRIGNPLSDGPAPAVAMNAAGDLYVSNNDTDNPAGRVGILRRLDAQTGDVLETIGVITDGSDSEGLRVSSLTFHPLTSVLYGISSKGPKEGTIFTIDTSTAVATAVGATGLKRGGLAFTNDGHLYLATADPPDSFNDPVIARIDPTDGTVIGTPVELSMGIEISGLAIRPSDGTFFAAYADGSDLFTIDPVTGTQVEIGRASGPDGSVAGLTFRPGAVMSTQGFLLPEKIRLKVNEARPERSSLKASVRIDECCAGLDLDRVVELHVNGRTWSLESAKVNAKGTRLVFADEGMKVVLRRGLGGTSRGALTVALKGDLGGLATPDGDVMVRLVGGGLDVEGTATLANGRFVRRRGDAVDTAALVPLTVSGKTADPGKSRVKAKLVLTTGAAAPTSAPDAAIQIGTFGASLPGDTASVRGDRIEWTARDAGVRRLRVDYARQEITLQLEKATLGYDSGPLTIRVQIGAVDHAVTIVPRSRGSSFRY